MPESAHIIVRRAMKESSLILTVRIFTVGESGDGAT